MESNMRDCNFRPLKYEQNELNLLFTSASTKRVTRARSPVARPPAAFSRYFLGVMLASSISNG